MGKQSVSILEVLENATEAQLQELREQIGTLARRLDAMRQLEKVLHVQLHGKPPRAAPGTGKSKGGRPKGSVTDDYRRRAGMLLLKGARRVAEVAEDCEIPSGSISGVLDHPWFGRNGAGEVHITTEGRRALG